MGWERVRVALAIAIAGSGCRSGFDDHIPGIGVDVVGVRLSSPGALVLEDGHYDAAPALADAGFAIAWVEYPEHDRTPQLAFAVIAEDGRRVVAPTTIEVLPAPATWVRVYTGATGYLVVTGRAGMVVFTALDAAGVVRARREDSGPAYVDLAGVPSGDGYVIAYTAGSLISTAVLDANGNPVGTPITIETQTPAQYDPTLASLGGELGLVWVDERSGGPRLHYTWLDAAGVPQIIPSIPVYDSGGAQGQPHLAPDGAGGFLVAHDDKDSFPERLMRISRDGVAMWPAAAVVYDEPRYHDTIDVAGSPGGHAGFAWVTEADTLLTNIYVTAIDGNVGSPPAVPAPALVTDPSYSFCYPEAARATASFGTAFAGEVEGSLALFLVIVPD